MIRGGIGGALPLAPLLDSDNDGDVQGIGEEERPPGAAAAVCFALIAAISSVSLSNGLKQKQ